MELILINVFLACNASIDSGQCLETNQKCNLKIFVVIRYIIKKRRWFLKEKCLFNTTVSFLFIYGIR